LKALEPVFASAEPAMLEHLAFLESLSDELASLGSEPPPAPRWNQDWFPGLDAAAAYAMVRRFAPRRIVEVGSGHSTRFFARAAADGRTQTAIVAIDPAPRASLANLPIELLCARVEEVGARAFASLASGDFLVVDSSHKIAPGSDVEFLLHEVLPALAPGVHVHFHDMFLPDDYPAGWEWRGYNEQAAVAQLIASENYEIRFSSHWIRSRRPQSIATGVLSRLPLLATAIESSLWLRKAAR